MAIPTTRTNQKGEIIIHADKCTGCGLCVSVCKDYSLEMDGPLVRISNDPIFGCIACGHCMAICPTEAIEIHGRCLSPGELFDLPDKKEAANYKQLITLFQRRRSIREFQDREVEAEKLDKILKAARTAPMGLPPSDVHVLILENKAKSRAFAKDFCEYLRGMQWFVSGWFLALMRPFWGKNNDAMFRDFVRPVFNTYTRNMEEGLNLVNYDAPLTLYFYATPFADPADPIVAATHAMIAGQALGLGTCMLGAIHPLIQNGRRAKKFREEHGIRFKSREGLFVIFGYPAVKYKMGINRTFASSTPMPYE